MVESIRLESICVANTVYTTILNVKMTFRSQGKANASVS